jgi:hypothetical protein
MLPARLFRSDGHIKGTKFSYDYQSKLAHNLRSQMRKRFIFGQAEN